MNEPASAGLFVCALPPERAFKPAAFVAVFFRPKGNPMAYYFPEGSKFYFSSTFASAKTITVLTNATPPVATSTTHGYSDNDELLINSGWDDINGTVAKADQLTTDTFSLLGLDTSNTNFYPAGSGIGSAQKISNWVEIPQILTISSQGGDARFTTVQPLARRNAFNVPVGFNAETVNITMGHDAANANYQTMLGIGRNLTPVAFKQVLSGGAVTYGYGYMIVGERPQLNSGQANSVIAALTMIGKTVSYSS